MRTLLFSHETTLSGAPLALFYLACWLQEQERAPVVAAPEAGPISDLLAARGIATVLDASFLADTSRRQLDALCADFEVVVANTLASWPVVRATRAAGRCAIWYLHETLVALELAHKIPEIRPTFAQADLLITPTRQTARLYRGICETEIEVVPYGIPEPAAVAPPAGGERRQFLCLASYEPRKGQDVLLEAIARLEPEVRERSVFTFAGRNLDENFFRQLETRAASLKNVQLGGALDHDESVQRIAQSDVLICSSRDETMPISIIEAMALGKTVVSTDVGGIAEWIRDGLNGFLVPPDDPDALAKAIAKCPDAVAGVSARRTFRRHFTLERFGRKFTDAIQRAASGGDPEPPTYAQWVTNYGTVRESDRIALRRQMRSLGRQPLISIVLPIYNPEIEFLRAAITSVTGQIYERWELCLADDASTDPAVRPLLEEMAASDARIKVTFRERNGHISAASNSALALATGVWCALLDQDDAFAEDALARVALEIARHPRARLIYSDEDKIDEAGVRSNPFFKTDWNPELFLAQNFINHLGVYEMKLVREIGGFREGFEGSQDYDLALRCLERLEPDEVRHIPRVLYHWRMAGGSLAAVPDAKPYAREAARRALADHLQRRAIPARVEACPENPESHRVIYEAAAERPLVSIIIPTRDKVHLLQRCLESLRERTDYSPFEIIIIDNGSVEEATLQFLRALPEQALRTRVVREEGEFNFSRLINGGVAEAAGSVLAFLNNDVEAENAEWLGEMVSLALRPGAGAVGARLWYPEGSLQHGATILGLGGVAGHAFHRFPRGHPGYFNRLFLAQNCSAVTAACMVVRREVFAAVGGFDEANLGISFNDVDFCVRLRKAGRWNAWTPYANFLHHESASRGHHTALEEQAQFFREATYMQETHGEMLLEDPFYNPNLALSGHGFTIAFPPRKIAKNSRP